MTRDLSIGPRDHGATNHHPGRSALRPPAITLSGDSGSARDRLESGALEADLLA